MYREGIDTVGLFVVDWEMSPTYITKRNRHGEADEGDDESHPRLINSEFPLEFF